MSHWMTVTLRCWVAFIAFMNFGASFRCFTEDSFVRSKFFGTDSQSWKSNEGPILERLYGFWSLLNGIILSSCFFLIEEKMITGLTVCVITLYLCFFAMEGYLYRTLLIHGPTIYPFVLSAITLLLLLGNLKHKGNKSKEEVDENEVLRRQFQFKSLSRKMQ